MISVRLFLALPSEVSFEATGTCSPRPAAVIRFGFMIVDQGIYNR